MPVQHIQAALFISELLFRKQSQHACSIFHRRVDQIRSGQMMVTCKKFRASHRAWREGNKGTKETESVQGTQGKERRREKDGESKGRRHGRRPKRGSGRRRRRRKKKRIPTHQSNFHRAVSSDPIKQQDTQHTKRVHSTSILHCTSRT